MGGRKINICELVSFCFTLLIRRQYLTNVKLVPFPKKQLFIKADPIVELGRLAMLFKAKM